MHAARFSRSSLHRRGARAGRRGAQPMTVDEFRRELVGVPLCGTPDCGQFAGKQLCTVHLPDGTAILAGAGLVVYGLWEAERRADLPPQRAGPARPAPLRDLRARRPQPFPQQRRRRLLPRAVRERQVADRSADSASFWLGPARKRRNLSYDRRPRITLGGMSMRAALAVAAALLIARASRLRRKSSRRRKSRPNSSTASRSRPRPRPAPSSR